MSDHPDKIGKYEILAEVGRGGMGTVYKARDPILDRVLALKTMSPEVVAEPGMRERFLREARSAARLQHPNIVTVYEFGEVEGAPFIAMEFLEGENLADALDGGRLPDVSSKLGIVIQLCDGLAYAHQHGVVHRDVKPTNVSILPGGIVKIVDFGIAWLEGGVMATRTGQLLGTPTYMAPEQFSGGAIDHHVDMWAVGVILYEMLTGRRPFSSDTVPSLIYQIVHTPPPRVDWGGARIPPRLTGIIELALAKDPHQRFPDLGAMARALREVRADNSSAPGAEPIADGPHRTVPDADATKVTALMPQIGQRSAGPRPETIPSHTPTPWRMAFIDNGTFGEPRRVQVIELSPDESILAAGGTDGSIRLWDLASRSKVATLRNREHMRSGHASLTTSIAFSDDGALLASGHLDGSIYLWELASGLELEARLSHDGAIGGLAIPPGGKTLVSGGGDATIRFWDLAAARARDTRRELRRQPDAVTCLALSGAGKLVVTGHSNRALRVHDVKDHRLVATLHGHHAPVTALAASPADDLVASGARDGAVHLHRLESREPCGFFQEHTRPIAALAFFPDAQRVATVAMDTAVVIWDAREPEVPSTLSGDPGTSFACVRVSRDGKRLICATVEGFFRVWLCQD